VRPAAVHNQVMIKGLLLQGVQSTVRELTNEFDEIPPARRKILSDLTDFITRTVSVGNPVYLNFICTHNSRRSHLSQLWAQTAAHYYGIANVFCFSGGTEATAFNPRAVKAMRDAGFSIVLSKGGDNPTYDVKFSDTAPTVTAFSKRYDDPFNQSPGFAAVMTCSHADEHCPIVLGATERIALTYADPKDFDGTELEGVKYGERVREIGREILFAFSRVGG